MYNTIVEHLNIPKNQKRLYEFDENGDKILNYLDKGINTQDIEDNIIIGQQIQNNNQFQNMNYNNNIIYPNNIDINNYHHHNLINENMNYPNYENIQIPENQFNLDYYYNNQKNNSLYYIPENQQNEYLNNNTNEYYYNYKQIPENINEINDENDEVTDKEKMNDNNSNYNESDIGEFCNNILYNSNSGEKIILKNNNNDNEKNIEKYDNF